MELWNYGFPEAKGEEGPDARFLREHVLELPIHQDVTHSQVEYMADQVLHLKLPTANFCKSVRLRSCSSLD